MVMQNLTFPKQTEKKKKRLVKRNEAQTIKLMFYKIFFRGTPYVTVWRELSGIFGLIKCSAN